MIDKILKLLDDYIDWLQTLPTFSNMVLTIATIGIPVFVIMFSLRGALGNYIKTECLDSHLARRWSPDDWTCEEYQDNGWIAVDVIGDNIYYYNNAASQ